MKFRYCMSNSVSPFQDRWITLVGLTREEADEEIVKMLPGYKISCFWPIYEAKKKTVVETPPHGFTGLF